MMGSLRDIEYESEWKFESSSSSQHFGCSILDSDANYNTLLLVVHCCVVVVVVRATLHAQEI